MRLATVDVGTNAAKLLISELAPGGVLMPLKEDRCMIRLGEGVDAHGILTDGAIERLVKALRNFQAIADQWHVEQCIVVGTSASRDTGDSIIDVVKERTGLHYEILSGEQEADMSFEGAISGLPHVKGQVVSCDIGGGSTELVKGTSDGHIFRRSSLDIGSVRIVERYFSCQPPKPDEFKAARKFIRHSLVSSSFSKRETVLLIGASDTHRLLLELQNALAWGELSVASDNPDPRWRCLKEMGTHQDEISYVQVRYWLECLTQMSAHDVLSLDPKRLKGRSDVFPAALLICQEVMSRLEQESIIVSQWGLCHGIALRNFRQCNRAR